MINMSNPKRSLELFKLLNRQYWLVCAKAYEQKIPVMQCRELSGQAEYDEIAETATYHEFGGWVGLQITFDQKINPSDKSDSRRESRTGLQCRKELPPHLADKL